MPDKKVYVADCEVFKEDWVVIAKSIDDGEDTVIIHNDNGDAKRLFEREDASFCFFNGKHYDAWIVQAICTDADVETVKSINDFIIEGNNGWEHPWFKDHYFRFTYFDIMDDMQMGLSLKAIEGHLGEDIRESEVDFTIDRALTDEELDETIRYCIYDIDSTIKLLKQRRDYIQTKLVLGNRIGIEPDEALYMTNAKLTAALLGAEKVERSDERAYMYPKQIDFDAVPKEAIDFFNRVADKRVEDEELWSSHLDIEVGGCPVTLGFGGIHGALTKYHEQATDTRCIVNVDVASLYPSLMINFGYTSRNIPDPTVFEEVYKERLKAKAEGDKATSNALKLVLNTTYGAMLNKYNDLYDPLMGRSVCITGQLLMLMLATYTVNLCATVRLIQLNTDGLMVSIDRDELGMFEKIVSDWEAVTGFTMEYDFIEAIHQKDVNNYVMVAEDGSNKVKGGYLVRGQSKAGAYNINNDALAVADAVRYWFTDGIDPEVYIKEWTHAPFEFQLIAKASSKYSSVFQMVGEDEVAVQKCNRVYAAKDENLGTLYKVKKADGSIAKIPSLPEHCIIDNSNEMEMTDIDLDWYVSLARKRIEAFGDWCPTNGTRERKEMATSKQDNALRKLLTARKMFLEANVRKTGVNQHLEFKYFELDDIVPVATKIFDELGIIPIVNINREEPTMEIVNVDNPNDRITFSVPYAEMPPIISKQGKEVTNALQCVGISITYLRRYLYMLALDICEPDMNDATIGEDGGKKVSTKQKPVRSEERKETVRELTNKDGEATKTQLNALTRSLKKLKSLDDAEETLKYISETAARIKEGITKKECDELTVLTASKIADVEGGAKND